MPAALRDRPDRAAALRGCPGSPSGAWVLPASRWPRSGAAASCAASCGSDEAAGEPTGGVKARVVAASAPPIGPPRHHHAHPFAFNHHVPNGNPGLAPLGRTSCLCATGWPPGGGFEEWGVRAWPFACARAARRRARGGAAHPRRGRAKKHSSRAAQKCTGNFGLFVTPRPRGRPRGRGHHAWPPCLAPPRPRTPAGRWGSAAARLSPLLLGLRSPPPRTSRGRRAGCCR